MPVAGRMRVAGSLVAAAFGGLDGIDEKVGFVSAQQFLGIKQNPDWVFLEIVAAEPILGFLLCGEGIDLKFDTGSVRIMIVHGYGRAVVDRPERDDALIAKAYIGR